MRAPAISLEKLESLLVVYRAVIPPACEDRNGHMNMRWYAALYDEAGDAMYPMLGLTEDYFAASGAGGFDLEHHFWYPAEVRIGDTVVIRARLLARNSKLFHYMMFMVNETRGVLSSLFECVHAHADLRIRRTSPFPAPVAAQIDALINAHRALTWPSPVSGSMSLESPERASGASGLTVAAEITAPPRAGAGILAGGFGQRLAVR
jgi:acyl-CoA thioester hydrolase